MTCFLCMILIAACVESFSLRAPGWQPLVMLALLMTGGIVCVMSWRRYHIVLVRAQHTGEQSTCSQCRTYGRFQVLEPAPSAEQSLFRRSEPDADLPDPQLKVCCRQCGHEWTID